MTPKEEASFKKKLKGTLFTLIQGKAQDLADDLVADLTAEAMAVITGESIYWDQEEVGIKISMFLSQEDRDEIERIQEMYDSMFLIFRPGTGEKCYSPEKAVRKLLEILEK